jgi:hypothetical protein
MCKNGKFRGRSRFWTGMKCPYQIGKRRKWNKTVRNFELYRNRKRESKRLRKYAYRILTRCQQLRLARCFCFPPPETEEEARGLAWWVCLALFRFFLPCFPRRKIVLKSVIWWENSSKNKNKSWPIYYRVGLSLQSIHMTVRPMWCGHSRFWLNSIDESR